MKIVKTILMLCSSVAAVTGMGTNFGVRNYMQNRLRHRVLGVTGVHRPRPTTNQRRPAINLRTLLNQINEAQKNVETFQQMLKKTNGYRN